MDDKLCLDSCLRLDQNTLKLRLRHGTSGTVERLEPQTLDMCVSRSQNLNSFGALDITPISQKASPMSPR